MVSEVPPMASLVMIEVFNLSNVLLEQLNLSCLAKFRQDGEQSSLSLPVEV